MKARERDWGMEKKGKTREEVWRQKEGMQWKEGKEEVGGRKRRRGQIGQNEGEINEWEVGENRQEEGERNNFEICILCFTKSALRRNFNRHLTDVGEGRYPSPVHSSHPVPPSGAEKHWEVLVTITVRRPSFTETETWSQNGRTFPSPQLTVTAFESRLPGTSCLAIKKNYKACQKAKKQTNKKKNHPPPEVTEQATEQKCWHYIANLKQAWLI